MTDYAKTAQVVGDLVSHMTSAAETYRNQNKDQTRSTAETYKYKKTGADKIMGKDETR